VVPAATFGKPPRLALVNAARRIFAAALGRRLPFTDGVLMVDGLTGPVRIRRDRYGIPHIDAAHDLDGWYALGFCQGQDRGFQIELLTRVVQGTTAALIGPDTLPIDRLSRRVGFARSGAAHLAIADAVERAAIEAFTAGVVSGRGAGSPRPPHELTLLRGEATGFTAADCLGVVLLQAFALASNWDAELARLLVLERDGEHALAALDPGYPEWHPVADPPGAAAGPAVSGLLDDVARFRILVGTGGGSNNWALAPERTATGRPILANDPHLGPVLPPFWYLAHVTTPEWSIAGAALAGTPGFAAAHNGHVAWGVTAGLVDNTDLFVETVDGTTVRRGDEWVECEVLHEEIVVRGADAVDETVLVTPHGPIVGPALSDAPEALSMSATWLTPERVSILARGVRARSVGELRDALAGWHGPSLNVVSADTSGSIGWKLVGQAPLRRSGTGALPMPAWDPDVGWMGQVAFDDMPGAADPEVGYLATANTRPAANGPFLGVDWIDGYRLRRINDLLAPRRDWDLAGTLAAQLDTVSPVWEEVRSHLAPVLDRSGVGRLLGDWDGDLAAGSVAASVFVLWLREMECRVATARAPMSAEFVVGRGFMPPLVPINLFGFSRTGHLVRLLRERPDGWFADWDAEIGDALVAAESTLRDRFGADAAQWAWGRVRPLRLLHPVGSRKPLDRVFNLGPLPWSGDFSTVSQSGAPALDPLGNPSAIASLRMAVDVGNWDAARFALPGGQSGNPASPHYDDQLEPWRLGTGLPMPWSEAAVAAATVETLHLVPAG